MTVIMLCHSTDAWKHQLAGYSISITRAIALLITTRSQELELQTSPFHHCVWPSCRGIVALQGGYSGSAASHSQLERSTAALTFKVSL
jgi:hypothetical protein